MKAQTFEIELCIFILSGARRARLTLLRNISKNILFLTIKYCNLMNVTVRSSFTQNLFHRGMMKKIHSLRQCEQSFFGLIKKKIL